jgi:hypothetical protein
VLPDKVVGVDGTYVIYAQLASNSDAMAVALTASGIRQPTGQAAGPELPIAAGAHLSGSISMDQDLSGGFPLDRLGGLVRQQPIAN